MPCATDAVADWGDESSGEIWTVAGGKDCAGKPRPVIIAQEDSFDATDSITIYAFTADEIDASLFRRSV